MSMSPDYKTLIDAQTWAFIEKTEGFYGHISVDSTVQEQRDAYNTMCRSFHPGRPASVATEDQNVSGVDIRVYRSTAHNDTALVLYLHGGGYVVAGLDSHDDVCAQICDDSGLTVVAVDYRLAPEHKHPAAFDDCISIYNWALDTFNLPLILVGDSAGGNLCAGVSAAAARKPKAQVLIYPSLGGDSTTGSYVTHANAPMLTTKDMAFYEQIRLSKAPDPKDTSYAPLWGKDFSMVPPTFIVTAECDPLASDGPAYATELENQGIPVVCREEKGLVHGYLRARHSVERATRSFERILQAVNLFASEQRLDQVALNRLL
ncbi:MAG: alpha/beta hydrolase [Alphaproteobacteria bacterium]